MLKSDKKFVIKAGQDGRLMIPAEITSGYGISPGEDVTFKELGIFAVRKDYSLTLLNGYAS